MPEPRLRTLTQRDLRTVKLISEGHTHQQIANMEGVSRHTVESRLSMTYKKLNVHSGASAAVMCVANNWI